MRASGKRRARPASAVERKQSQPTAWSPRELIGRSEALKIPPKGSFTIPQHSSSGAAELRTQEDPASMHRKARNCTRTSDDVTATWRRGLRPASGGPASDQPVALHERLLARPGHDARHGRSGVAVLSHAFAD